MRKVLPDYRVVGCKWLLLHLVDKKRVIGRKALGAGATDERMKRDACFLCEKSSALRENASPLTAFSLWMKWHPYCVIYTASSHCSSGASVLFLSNDAANKQICHLVTEIVRHLSEMVQTPWQGCKSLPCVCLGKNVNIREDPLGWCHRQRTM